LQAALPKTATIDGGLAGASPVYGSLVDGLVVLDDLGMGRSRRSNGRRSLDRQKRPFATRLRYLEDCRCDRAHRVPLVLRERAQGRANGQELFLASCGLMATGAELSCSRAGGRAVNRAANRAAVCAELPFDGRGSLATCGAVNKRVAARRSSRAAASAVCNGPAIDGGHPFFWAGYMVFDAGVIPHGKAEPVEAPVLKFEAQKDDKAAKPADEDTKGDAVKDKAKESGENDTEKGDAGRVRKLR
jgi:hypothetical protein